MTKIYSIGMAGLIRAKNYGQAQFRELVHRGNPTDSPEVCRNRVFLDMKRDAVPFNAKIPQIASAEEMFIFLLEMGKSALMLKPGMPLPEEINRKENTFYLVKDDVNITIHYYNGKQWDSKSVVKEAFEQAIWEIILNKKEAQWNEQDKAEIRSRYDHSFLLIERGYTQDSASIAGTLVLECVDQSIDFITGKPMKAEHASGSIFHLYNDASKLGVSGILRDACVWTQEGEKIIPGEVFVRAKTRSEGGIKVQSVRASNEFFKILTYRPEPNYDDTFTNDDPFDTGPIESYMNGTFRYPSLKVYGLEIITDKGRINFKNLTRAIDFAREEEKKAEDNFGNFKDSFALYSSECDDEEKKQNLKRIQDWTEGHRFKKASGPQHEGQVVWVTDSKEFNANGDVYFNVDTAEYGLTDEKGALFLNKVEGDLKELNRKDEAALREEILNHAILNGYKAPVKVEKSPWVETFDTTMAIAILRDLPLVLKGEKDIEKCPALIDAIVWCGNPELSAAIEQALRPVIDADLDKFNRLIAIYGSGDSTADLAQAYFDAVETGDENQIKEAAQAFWEITLASSQEVYDECQFIPTQREAAHTQALQKEIIKAKAVNNGTAEDQFKVALDLKAALEAVESNEEYKNIRHEEYLCQVALQKIIDKFANSKEKFIVALIKQLTDIQRTGFAAFNADSLKMNRFYRVLPLFERYCNSLIESSSDEDESAYKKALALNKWIINHFYPIALGETITAGDPLVTQMRELRAAIEERVEAGLMTHKEAAESLQKVNLELIDCVSYLAGPRKENFEPTMDVEVNGEILKKEDALFEQKIEIAEDKVVEKEVEEVVVEEVEESVISRFMSSSASLTTFLSAQTYEDKLGIIRKELAENTRQSTGQWNGLLADISAYNFEGFNKEELECFRQILPLFKEYTETLNSNLSDKEAYAQALALNERISNKFYPIALGEKVAKNDPLVAQMLELRKVTEEAVKNGHITPKVAAETLQKVNLELVNCMSYLAGPRKENFKPATNAQDWASIRNASMNAADSPAKKWASRILMGVGVILAIGVGAALVAGVLVATGGLAAIPLVAVFVAPIVSPTIAVAAAGAVAGGATLLGIGFDRSRRKKVKAHGDSVDRIKKADQLLTTAIATVAVPQEAAPVERDSSIKQPPEKAPVSIGDDVEGKSISEGNEESKDTSKEVRYHTSPSTFFHDEPSAPQKPATTPGPRPVSPGAGNSGPQKG